MEHVQKKSGNITVKVDYRTELLGIIMCISNYRNKFPSMFQPYENQFYVQNIIDKFGKYKEENVIFGGRLGQYKYYDMDKIIEEALSLVEKVREENH